MAKSGDTKNKLDSDTINIDNLRSIVTQYSELGQWKSALFWVDKVVALQRGEASNDIWLLAKTMISQGEYHRALHAVTSRGLHLTHLLSLHVALQALLMANEHQHALQLLTDVEPDMLEHNMENMPQNRVIASVYVAKGRALSALERRGAAVDAFVAALRADVCCFEALDLLLEHHAYTLQQERELIEGLSLTSQAGRAGAALLTRAYRAHVDRYGANSTDSEMNHDDTPPWEAQLQVIEAHSADAVVCRARKLLHRCEWLQCLRALDSIDGWVGAELRVACLVELRRVPELFALAHTLVDCYPQVWTSWFAVGCYYYLIGKNEFARRYLCKAKALHGGAGCVWLAYGHSFALDNEHDQAMAAYFKASQLLPGCHLPALYISVECTLLNNTGMAEKFLARAAGLHHRASTLSDTTDDKEDGGEWRLLVEGEWEAPCDPHVPHEAGAAAFAVGNYKHAEMLFRRALDQVHSVYDGAVPERWHALLDNLGHACRKTGKYEEALGWHERALACRPGKSSTYAAMGFCLALLGRTERAVLVLHAALARDPDDAVSLALLNYLIDNLADCPGDDEVPQFPFPSVSLSLGGTGPPAQTPGRMRGAGDADLTTHDMSMSFD